MGEASAAKWRLHPRQYPRGSATRGAGFDVARHPCGGHITIAAARPVGTARLRILVAEENEVNCLFMPTLLDRPGHAADGVDDGA